MKYSFIILLIFFLLKISFSQEQFNVILEDTIGHITNSVIENDGFYYVLSGTGSENGVRCFSLTKVNQSGEIQWKNIIDNDTLELWEGRNHSLKKTSNGFFIAGSAINISSNYRGFHFSNFDQNMEFSSQDIVMYDTIWQQCFNSVKTENGDLYITGQYYDDTLQDAPLYLMKFNALNEFIWKRGHTYSYSSGSQLLECMNGDIICSGIQSPSSYNDWLINRYTTQGDLLWSKRFGWFGSRNDGAVSALAETPDSCIIACGSYPGIKTMTDTYYDGCIRKIDKNGELVWEKLYRDYAKLEYPSIVLTTNTVSDVILKENNYYFLGSNRDHRSASRGYLMKTNQYGDILWRNIYYAIDTNSTYQWLNSFQLTNDSGFILSGYGNSYDRQGYDPPQQRWLIKTDSLGMDGLCNTEPDVLEVDIDLPDEMCAFDTTEVYLHIAGPTAPYTVNISNGQIFDSIYYPPVFVPKEIGPSTIEISYDGITIMEFEEPEVTISNHDWGECIAIPIEYHVGNQVGFVNLDITVTDGWGNSKTTSKLVFIKTCPDGMNDISLNQLQIYPNPASNSITIDLSNNHRSLKADIFDAQGKHVLSTNITGEQTTINIRSLPAGSYQFVIEKTSHNFTVVK